MSLALWKMTSTLCDLDNGNCMAAEHIQLVLTIQMNDMCTSCILKHQCCRAVTPPVKPVHLPCSLNVYERHSGAPSTFLFVALKDLPKNFKGPACVAVTLVVNHTLQTQQTLVVSIADDRNCTQNLMHFISVICETPCIHRSPAHAWGIKPQ